MNGKTIQLAGLAIAILAVVGTYVQIVQNAHQPADGGQAPVAGENTAVIDGSKAGRDLAVTAGDGAGARKNTASVIDSHAERDITVKAGVGEGKGKQQ